MVTTFVRTNIEKFSRMDQLMYFSMGKFNSLEAGQRNQSAILQDLQNQIGGIAQNNSTGAPGTLPSNFARANRTGRVLDPLWPCGKSRELTRPDWKSTRLCASGRAACLKTT
ncbi:unnamed protein product [Linum trigynum]|uniref:Uncharacterized protein n=1 Tax=Linum trigynum TaxID=586398 RepID=A0AAV2FXS0_9ROSI